MQRMIITMLVLAAFLNAVNHANHIYGDKTVVSEKVMEAI